MASLLSAKNETVFALGNANLEFSLVKVEVKKEYDGLGKALSRQRRASAEEGLQHRTARRLFALFEDVIPDIGVLATAYGQRASEIALATHNKGSNMTASMASEFGPFAEHAGVDGTSIYAAASSGDHVIALHLLACMLAKVFTSAEATAIWVQLVEGRLTEMREKAQTAQLSGLAALYAVSFGEQILRDDLAAWDASARAWLEVANAVKRREDTQVKLIFRNIPNVQSSKSTYTGIIENWKLAMMTLQNSIEGVPQDVSNGAVLLGIAAWHIYPDINVFGPTRHISLGDSLVKKGGIICLGLERNTDVDTGVSWSVSLSHLRYYGEPVPIDRSLNLDTDRITIQELLYVTLGCLLSSWSHSLSFDIVEVSECLVALGQCVGITSNTQDPYYSDLGWLVPLIKAASNLLHSHGNDRANALYFVEFGRRRGHRLLDDNFRDSIPVFGLVNPYQMFRVSRDFERDRGHGDGNNCRTNLKNQNIENSIKIYRQLAQDCNFDKDECVIVNSHLATAKGNLAEEDGEFEGHWELASAIPLPRFTGKHSEDGTLKATERHIRWIHVDRTKDPALQRLIEVGYFAPPGPIHGTDEWEDKLNVPWNVRMQLHLPCRCKQLKLECNSDCSCRKQHKSCTSLCMCVASLNVAEDGPDCSNIRECRAEYDVPEEDCLWLSLGGTESIDNDNSLNNRSFQWEDPPTAFQARYESVQPDGSLDMFLCLDPEAEALPHSFDFGKGPDIYRRNSVGRSIRFLPIHTQERVGLFLSDRATISMPQTTIFHLKTVLMDGRLDTALLRRHLSWVRNHGVTDYSNSLDGKNSMYTGRVFFQSLYAVAAVSELYCDWPDATIQISITKKPIGAAHWAQNLPTESFDLASKLDGFQTSVKKSALSKINRSTKFACLAMLESGGIDIHPDQLDLVMGMATANSIYAAEYLLQDPNSTDRSGDREFIGIRRIFGSLGEPGIVFLVPPPSPRREQFDSVQHRLVRHDIFDGNLIDRFKESSIHLKLTALKIPLVTAQGAIDADVVIREALVRVFDGSRWVADLDVIKGLEDPKLIRLPGCSCLGIQQWCSLGEQLTNELGESLKSISRWDELLLCRDNLLRDELGAVRSSGNWFARLAAAILALSIGCPTTLLPCGRVCLSCGKRLASWRPFLEADNVEVRNVLIM